MYIISARSTTVGGGSVFFSMFAHFRAIKSEVEEEQGRAKGASSLAARVVVIELCQTVKMNKLNKPQEFDSYEIEEPSDEERACSR